METYQSNDRPYSTIVVFCEGYQILAKLAYEQSEESAQIVANDIVRRFLDYKPRFFNPELLEERFRLNEIEFSNFSVYARFKVLDKFYFAEMGLKVRERAIRIREASSSFLKGVYIA